MIQSTIKQGENIVAVAIKHFDVLEYVKKAKEFGIKEEFAEYSARQIELLSDTIQEQNIKINQLESKEPVTKSDVFAIKEDIKKLELKIEQYRYNSLKFIVWTGVAVVALSGVIFTILKLMLH